MSAEICAAPESLQHVALFQRRQGRRRYPSRRHRVHRRCRRSWRGLSSPRYWRRALTGCWPCHCLRARRDAVHRRLLLHGTRWARSGLRGAFRGVP